MNSELVFIKTASGEEAVRARSRSLPHGVRTLLILVDGHSTLAELGAKVSNLALAETALRDLERAGYIARREIRPVERGASTANREAALSAPQASVAAPVSEEPAGPLEPRLFAASNSGNDEESGSVVDSAEAEDSGGLDSFPVLNEVIEPAHNPAIQDGSVPAFSANPVQAPDDTADGRSLVNDKVDAAAKKRKRTAGSERIMLVKNLRSRLARPKKSERPDAADKFLRPRRPLPSLKKILAFALVGGLLALALLVVFFPFSLYLPDAESALSASLGRTVRIGRLDISFYPKPGVRLGDIAIAGLANDAQDGGALNIDEILLEPELETLFSSAKSYRRVFVRGVTLPLESVAVLPTVLGRINRPDAPFYVKRIYFEQAAVQMRGLSIDNLKGEANLSESGRLVSLPMRTDDHSLSLTLTPTPTGQRLEIALDGVGVRIPALAPLVFDSVSLKGVWEDGALAVPTFDLRVLDGTVKGRAIVRPAKRIDVDGELNFDHVNSVRLSTVLGLGSLLSGDLAGKARFSGVAETWPDILPSLAAEGDFAVQRGSLHGIDLAEAARRGFGTPVQGGMTNFEQLSGTMRLAATGSRFNNIVIRSGLMQSVGVLDVGANQTLSGRIDLLIRGSAKQMRVPIGLSGTLKAPSLQAGR